MKLHDQKAVTTNSDEARGRRRQRPDASLKPAPGPEHDFDRQGLLGLSDGALVQQVLAETQGGAARTMALDELEQRFGWQGAAQRLTAAGPQGAGVAQAQWGSWMNAAAPPELNAGAPSVAQPPEGEPPR